MTSRVTLACLVCLVVKVYAAPSPMGFGLFDWFVDYYDESTKEDKDKDSKDIYDEIFDYFYDIFGNEKQNETATTKPNETNETTTIPNEANKTSIKPNKVEPTPSAQTVSTMPQVTKHSSTPIKIDMTTTVEDTTTNAEEAEMKPRE